MKILKKSISLMRNVQIEPIVFLKSRTYMMISFEITVLYSNRTFNLLKMPCKLFEPGIIISGIIGKKESDLFWDLYQTEGIYPNRAKKYMEFA